MQSSSSGYGQSGAVDALLGSYAAGSLAKPLHALVASHLLLKSENRRFVSAMEQMIATSVEDEQHSTVANRKERIDAIIADTAQPLSHNAHMHTMNNAPHFIPAPLADYISKPFDELEWKSVMPGLREAKLQDTPGCEVSMLWIRAGRAMPSHTHAGLEATLVLQGSFADAAGRYGRGDISVVDSDIDHKPVAGTQEDCLCFAVSQGPVRLTGPIARLFQRLLKH